MQVVEKNGTLKQHRAARLFAENIMTEKPMSTEKILRKAGYAEVTARKQPTAVTRNATFQKLLQQYMPLQNIVRKHAEVLEDAEPAVQLKAVELGYKVYGVIEKAGNINNPVIIGLGWKAHPFEKPVHLEAEVTNLKQEPEIETPE